MCFVFFGGTHTWWSMYWTIVFTWQDVYYSSATLPDYHYHHQGIVYSLPFTVFCHHVMIRTALPYQRELGELYEEIRSIKKLLEEHQLDYAEEAIVCPSLWFTDCPARRLIAKMRSEQSTRNMRMVVVE